MKLIVRQAEIDGIPYWEYVLTGKTWILTGGAFYYADAISEALEFMAWMHEGNPENVRKL